MLECTITQNGSNRQVFSGQPLVFMGLPMFDYFERQGAKTVNYSPQPPDWSSKLEQAQKLLHIELPNSRSNFIDSHLDVLTCIFQKGQASMNDVADAIEQRANYVHVRLTNLFHAGILCREKKSTGINSNGRKTTEYVYSIKNKWPDPDKMQAKMDDEPCVKSAENNHAVSGSEVISAEKLNDLNLPKLPDYDPAWSEEIKAEWMKLYRHLLEIQMAKPE